MSVLASWILNMDALGKYTPYFQKNVIKSHLFIWIFQKNGLFCKNAE